MTFIEKPAACLAGKSLARSRRQISYTLSLDPRGKLRRGCVLRPQHLVRRPEAGRCSTL